MVHLDFELAVALLCAISRCVIFVLNEPCVKIRTLQKVAVLSRGLWVMDPKD